LRAAAINASLSERASSGPQAYARLLKREEYGQHGALHGWLLVVPSKWHAPQAACGKGGIHKA